MTDWLNKEQQTGRELILATGSHQKLAEQVANHLGLFSSILASDGKSNNISREKAAALVARYPGGFAYIGNSRADLQVWRAATAIGIVSPSPALLNQARKLGKPIIWKQIASKNKLFGQINSRNTISK